MEKYYLGLDIGTDSIGWAVTDEEYHIPKFKGNAMWGIRLFDGGETAAERRGYRSDRRRRQRSKFRLECLEMLFNKEIAKVDISFFQRLKDSALYDGDKTVEGRYSLFNDKNYTDKEYHKEYPTIYHLRKELIVNPAAHDVRLVYLVVSHIVKNRGHFLFESDDLGTGNNDFSAIWRELNTYLRDNYDSELYAENLSSVEDILKDRSLGIKQKSEALIKELGLSKKENSFETALLNLLSGAKVNAKNIFQTDEFDKTDAKTVSFKNGYDEKHDIYESFFGERFELIEKLKALYDWAVLADICGDADVYGGKKYISFAKVNEYNKHKSDLKLLKEYVKAFAPEKYDLIFNENVSGTNNYLAYSGHSSKQPVMKKCSQELFCEFLKKQLPKDDVDEKYVKMFAEIDAGTFMPKDVTKNNSVIPMQINREELKAILKNAQEYLPFLKELDESGKTVSEKIIDIFSFRVPYYVGPLNEHSEKHWLVRTKEKIYPWNFEKVVDTDASAEKFIDNLTSKCTYLPKEDVIPKNSLLYSSYMVLNELNNLKADGEPITVEMKQSIYRDLFMRKNKVTYKALVDYFRAKGLENVVISGVDGDFKSSLKAYRELDFIGLPDSDKEDIIKSITIFGDDKKLLKKRIQKNYGGRLTDEEITKLCRLKFTGWSRLSRKLLTGIESVLPETGEVTNIIHALWETNDNLMKLLSKNYQFRENIDRENGAGAFTSLKQEVEDLYVSPKIKRPIYQTMQIVEEIVKIQGGAPEKIFVEVTRFEGKKERKISRKQSLIELYKKCGEEQGELYENLKNTNENDLQRDALYLYYAQFGKCMYTGECINLDELSTNYDIDHIFPRSKLKDDSIDNRVLVSKDANQKKGDDYPIIPEIREKMRSFWKLLLSKELISKRKFERLVRNTPLSEEELNEFISRQLVETRQSTKAVAQLLKKRYPETDVEYIKAGLVSDFRKDFKMPKCREVNDIHHAKDAYLNIVVGNVYTVKASSHKFYSDILSGRQSFNRMFDYPTKGAWETENNKSISVVRSTMAKNNVRFTRYAFKQQGGLFDQNPLKKGFGQVERKKGLAIEKYGGYNAPSSSFFAFVAYTDKKGKKIRSFEPVDKYRENEYTTDPVAFIAERLGVEKDTVKILIPCVKYNALISIDGFRMHISSKSNGGSQIVCKPAVQLVLGDERESYVKTIMNYLNKCDEIKKEKEITAYDGIEAEKNMDIFNTITDKMVNTVFKSKFASLGKKLRNKKEDFCVLSLYQQCCVIKQILNILHANVMIGDLTLLGEAKKCGVTSISNKLQSGYSSAKLINQSVTGLYEQEVDLMKIR